MSVSTCSACGLVFNTDNGFDSHRTGTYVPMTRHCLTVAEIVSKGMTHNPNTGRWLNPVSTKKKKSLGRLRDAHSRVDNSPPVGMMTHKGVRVPLS